MAYLARRTAWVGLLVALPVVTGCETDTDVAETADDSACVLDRGPVALSIDIREISGVAVGIRNPSLAWTHNDRGYGSFLYAVDADGRTRARIELNQSADDWEDIDRGPCDLGACLYVAGTGDNDERREVISLYRLAEPEGEGDREVEAERYRMVLPDGPRDIEAMYVLPPEQIFFITKGRNHPITVYRYPSPLRLDEVVTLIEVQRLTTGPPAPSRQVTGASASLDGSTVAIRTYSSLELFDVTEGEQSLGSSVERVDLRALREPQGEGVGFGVDGKIVLTSEAGRGSGPSLTVLSCDIAGPV